VGKSFPLFFCFAWGENKNGWTWTNETQNQKAWQEMINELGHAKGKAKQRRLKRS